MPSSTTTTATANSVLSAVMIGSGLATVVLASTLAYFLLFYQQQNNNNSNNNKDNKKNDNKKNESNEATPPPPSNQLTVYFATQTGTAESFARQLEREGPSEHGLSVQVVDLEDLNASLEQLVLQNQQQQQQQQNQHGKVRAIFLVATYGEGEAPDNATTFVQALQEATGIPIFSSAQEEENNNNNNNTDSTSSTTSTSSTSNLRLANLEYCVFGLGNQQYDHYNAMGKFFDRALHQLGATRMAPLGMGNDDVDLEGDFETWKDQVLWPTLHHKFHTKSTTTVQQSQSQLVLPDCPYSIQYHDDDSTSSNPQKIPLEQVHGQSRHYFTACTCPVTMVRELRTNNNTTNNNEVIDSTVHVEIDISHYSSSQQQDVLRYQTADNLGVIPENEDSLVQAVAQRLGYDLNRTFSLHPSSSSATWHGIPFPMPLTVRDCLTRYCDLTGPPRRSDLKVLASYAHDALDRAALLRLSSKEGKAEYKEKILEQYVTILDLLYLCPSIDMPLEHFLNYCPLIQTRFFTISSSSSVYPNTIHLTVAVTQKAFVPQQKKSNNNTTTRNGGSSSSASSPSSSIFKGLCSNYLANFHGSSTSSSSSSSTSPSLSTFQPRLLRVFLRPSTFRLPPDCRTPILMIGPGTGIAPMRAMLQERAYQRREQKLPVGPNLLYFGCRNANQDFLYQDELVQFQKQGDLTQLHVAYSRPTTTSSTQNNQKKTYVQHLLAQNAADTWNWIHQRGAYIYVCGSVQMGHDVAETFRNHVFFYHSSSDHGKDNNPNENGSNDDDNNNNNNNNNHVVRKKEYFETLVQQGRYVQELWA